MFQFARLDYTVFLILLPISVAIFFFGWYRRKKALEQFADKSLFQTIGFEFSSTRYWVKAVLTAIGILFLILTLARPQGNPITQTVKKKGRDLVFILDVSNSMLAEDLGPNRIGKAKQLVSDLVKILEGDRIGLLVFAGSTAIKCPLTLDYNYFLNALARVSPEDINKGGTHIGDAIRVVSERLFYDQDNKYRDVILITDGEDHESFPIEAAEQAAQRGIKIHAIGLGNPDGANIPLRTGPAYNLMRYQDKIVTTKLDESTLKKIAEITHGVFIPVRTSQVDITSLYTNYISVSEKREAESKQSMVWSELFQFFLAIALSFLIFSTLLSAKRMRYQ